MNVISGDIAKMFVAASRSSSINTLDDHGNPAQKNQHRYHLLPTRTSSSKSDLDAEPPPKKLSAEDVVLVAAGVVGTNASTEEEVEERATPPHMASFVAIFMVFQLVE